MPQRIIALGAAPGDNSGNGLRTGGGYINDNFSELYALLAGWYSAKTYGAVGDGASHTVGTVLGVSTLAALAAYSHPKLGGTPYSWITSGLWLKSYAVLPLSVSAASGATTLTFAATTGVTTGMQVRGGGVAGGTTVSAVTGTTVTLSAGLTAAKAAGMKFAFVRPLADADVTGMEMDSLGTQAAIQAAKAAGGGTVYNAPGTYIFDTTIVLPESAEFSGQEVNWHGGGRKNTVYRAKADFGAGRFLISCGDPTANMNNLVGRYAFSYYEGHCEGFRCEGPVAKTPGVDVAYGTAPANMDGIAHGSRRTWRDVWAWYFRAGWNVVGDHSLFSECVGQYCYYGAYYDDMNPSLYGDYRFEYCFLMGNTCAGIGVSKNSMCNGYFLKPYLGGQPYAIAGEAGTSDSYGQPYAGSAEPPIIQGSTFVNGQWEWMGNGSIVDLNGLGAGTPTRPIIKTSIDNGYWSWNTGKAIAGRGQRYYFDFGAAEGLSLTNLGSDCFDTTAGQLALMRVTAVGFYGGGLDMHGGLETILGKYTAIPFLAPMDQFAEGQWRNVTLRSGSWTGRLVMVGTTAAIPKGTLIEGSPTDFAMGRIATGTAANPLLGVSVQAKPVTGTAAGYFIVVARGEHIMARYGTGTIGFSTWVKSTATGTLQPATGPTDGQVAGWVWHDNSGDTVSRTIRTTFA